MKTITRYFIRINNESIDQTISEYGSIENDGFPTKEAAIGDLETVKDDFNEGDTYEVIEVTVKAVTGKLTLKEE